ncbi:hypothetical protein TPENAI_70227 [Tenacibaculum litopenaei]
MVLGIILGLIAFVFDSQFLEGTSGSGYALIVMSAEIAFCYLSYYLLESNGKGKPNSVSLILMK